MMVVGVCGLGRALEAGVAQEAVMGVHSEGWGAERLRGGGETWIVRRG